ncbi:sugar ABC transporter ATP-binding protein [Vagococcus zengguangii]|uniref:Autoinducer 2 import ATP-binding protein LsrA n=1 Tax=Vagococcus zengguangii TaxID=2571750 RepID=A0A4D7CS63_9ENTE|nr:ATP-binding cassette domain-containing protein [Vagococcus zengguangii]QCI86938.1 ATP-binding cassette domain-containing protein [Vagococcus zengguangii]TLG81020.1 ATP-binding cassette domain-containing protein [Vagococcus zengguangii]
MGQSELLNCKSIVKSFGENHVLKGIDLCLNRGEVISIIGGNGAGKSTLMKIIMGIHKSDSGELFICEEKTNNLSPSLAISKGIYLVPQEPMLFPNMTVLENVLLGLKGSKIENKKKLLQIIDELGWKLDIERKATTLTIAEQQLVEILKGLVRESKILILDEPTSSLTFNEIKSLFRMIEDLKSKGVGLIYITHRLNEVFEISTHVLIMRDGKVTLKGKVTDFDNDMLIKALLPEETDDVKSTMSSKEEFNGEQDKVLQIDKLTGHGFKDITLDLRAGEILGMAGVVGAGRTELAETIFGKDEILSGKVFVGTNDITGKSTEEVIRLGLNYVPEDRFKNGIFKISDIGMNISASSIGNMGKVFLNRHYDQVLFEEYKQSFKIKASSIDEEIGTLSGGNQQKIVIAKALASVPKVLILDEPTRGIDAAAREDVYKIIYRLRSQGVGILLISSDMEEIIKLSDRAVTMHRGRINSEFEGDDINQDNLMSASFGVLREELAV